LSAVFGKPDLELCSLGVYDPTSGEISNSSALGRAALLVASG